MTIQHKCLPNEFACISTVRFSAIIIPNKILQALNMTPLSFILFVVTAFGVLVNVANSEQASIYINAGKSTDYLDSYGNTWAADDFFNTGSTFREIFWIFNTNNDQEGSNDREIYRSNRYDSDPDSPYLIYNITGK